MIELNPDVSLQMHQEKMKEKKKKKKSRKHSSKDSDSSDEEDEAKKKEKLKKVCWLRLLIATYMSSYLRPYIYALQSYF